MNQSNKNKTAKQLIVFVLIAVAVFVAANLLDRWAFAHLSYAKVYDKDWGRLLRTMGWLPTWLLAAAALAMCDWPRGGGSGWRRGRAAWGRGFMLALAPTLAGLAAESLKIIIRRERPELHDGAHVFRNWVGQWWKTSNLGLPSSHTAVAFAAATILAMLFPRAALIWFALAAGCALTRIMEKAHFLSDAAAGAVVGACVAWLLVRWCGGDRFYQRPVTDR